MIKKSHIIGLVVIVILIAVVLNFLIKDKENGIIEEGEPIGDSDVETVIDEEESFKEEQKNVAFVEIREKMYVPSELTIIKGTTVTWINKDFRNHKVVAKTILLNGSTYQEFNGDSIPKGGNYSFTFNKVGEFPYFDPTFVYMKGKVIVVE